MQTESILLRSLQQHKVEDKQFILAISGGIDSMVLATLFLKLNIQFVLAHCNFNLRGEESNGDEQFIRTWSAANDVRCFVQQFDTREILATQGGNLQETARTLRYKWFEDLRQELNFDFIATAHHANDSIETMLMNLFKGTGIRGLHGIQFKQANIIRPLIELGREQIKSYAEQNNVTWREDSSNKKDDYNRNYIRHHILPMVEKIYPAASQNLQSGIVRFSEAELLYEQSIERYRKKLIEKRKEDFYIPVLKLKNVRPLNTILYELIKPFGFTSSQMPQILHLLEAETGKYLPSATHRIIRNRDFLIIASIEQKETAFILLEQDDADNKRLLTITDFAIQMQYQEYNGNIESLPTDKNTAMIDTRQLEFPLILRRWKTGDYFYPLGMKKKKKVSRFLIDQKTPLHEKEKIWVIESGKKIVWIAGLRLDDRFRITASTKKMMRLTIK